jgi:hypothetical protein
MWLAGPPFVQNALAEVTRSSLGPWLVFALHTGLATAVLVFIFVVLVTLLFSLLLLFAGDPKKMLRTVVFLGPVAAFYSALHVGAVVGLLGWPVLLLLDRFFQLSPDATSWASSILSLNYVSVGLVSIAAVTLVIVAMGRGLWKRQHTLQAARAKERLAWAASANEGGVEETVSAHSTAASRTGYHRIGIVAGPLFAAPVLLAGLLLAREQHTLLPLVCSVVSAAAVFGVTYGIGQLLGALVDTFISKMHSAEHA